MSSAATIAGFPARTRVFEPRVQTSSRDVVPSIRKQTALPTRETFGDILRAVCRQRGWELLPSGVNVTHANGRHQVVSFEHFEFEQQQLIRLVSIIGVSRQMRAEQMEQALRANVSLAHGALAFSGDELCMTDTLSLEDSDPGEIESVVSYLAEMADYYEQVLFGTDEN